MENLIGKFPVSPCIHWHFQKLVSADPPLTSSVLRKDISKAMSPCIRSSDPRRGWKPSTASSEKCGHSYDDFRGLAVLQSATSRQAKSPWNPFFRAGWFWLSLKGWIRHPSWILEAEGRSASGSPCASQPRPVTIGQRDAQYECHLYSCSGFTLRQMSWGLLVLPARSVKFTDFHLQIRIYNLDNSVCEKTKVSRKKNHSVFHQLPHKQRRAFPLHGQIQEQDTDGLHQKQSWDISRNS